MRFRVRHYRELALNFWRVSFGNKYQKQEVLYLSEDLLCFLGLTRFLKSIEPHFIRVLTLFESVHLAKRPQTTSDEGGSFGCLLNVGPPTFSGIIAVRPQ